jgi:hypothetical protein
VGIDFIVRNDLITLQSEASISSPVLYVTNFSGETNVFPANDGTAVSTLPQLLVRQGETVSVEFVSSLSYVERNALENTTSDFWNTYDFAPPPASTVVVTAPVHHPEVETNTDSPSTVSVAETSTQADPEVTTTVEEIRYSPPIVIGNPEYEALIKRKNNAFLASLIFIAGGLVLEGVGMYYQYDGNSDRGYFFTLSGALVTGVGVGTLVHGLTIKLE